MLGEPDPPGPGLTPSRNLAQIRSPGWRTLMYFDQVHCLAATRNRKLARSESECHCRARARSRLSPVARADSVAAVTRRADSVASGISEPGAAASGPRARGNHESSASVSESKHSVSRGSPGLAGLNTVSSEHASEILTHGGSVTPGRRFHSPAVAARQCPSLMHLGDARDSERHDCCE